MAQIPSQFNALYEAGVQLRDDLEAHLISWPLDRGHPIRGKGLPDTFSQQTGELRDRVAKWFNQITVEVLPFTSQDRSHVASLFHQVSSAAHAARFYVEYRPAQLRIRHGKNANE